MIAKGKADFSKVLNHVLYCFKKKFEFFKLSIGTMEKILKIMIASTSHGPNRIATLTSKIPVKDEEKKTAVNFCIKCFKG